MSAHMYIHSVTAWKILIWAVSKSLFKTLLYLVLSCGQKYSIVQTNSCRKVKT